MGFGQCMFWCTIYSLCSYSGLAHRVVDHVAPSLFPQNKFFVIHVQEYLRVRKLRKRETTLLPRVLWHDPMMSYRSRGGLQGREESITNKAPSLYLYYPGHV